MSIMNEIELEIYGNQEKMQHWEDMVDDDDMDAADAGIMFGAESA